MLCNGDFAEICACGDIFFVFADETYVGVDFLS